MSYSILNKSLDIWEEENLTREKAMDLIILLEDRERKKKPNEWKYEFEIVEINKNMS